MLAHYLHSTVFPLATHLWLVLDKWGRPSARFSNEKLAIRTAIERGPRARCSILSPSGTHYPYDELRDRAVQEILAR